MNYINLAIISLISILYTACSGTHSGSNYGTTTKPVIVSNISTCSTNSSWDLQRNCLVETYRTDIDRCYDTLDEVKRQECVFYVQNRYNLRSTTYDGYWNNTYDRLDDPFYYQYSDYYNKFAYNYNYVDPWQTYWKIAHQNMAYYNTLYLNWNAALYRTYYGVYY